MNSDDIAFMRKRSIGKCSGANTAYESETGGVEIRPLEALFVRRRHKALHNDVAIKVLHQEFARDPEFVKRFINGARNAALYESRAGPRRRRDLEERHLFPRGGHVLL